MDAIILDTNLSKAFAHGGCDEFDAFDDGRDNVCDEGATGGQGRERENVSEKEQKHHRREKRRIGTAICKYYLLVRLRMKR